jgi:WD40 repeat protein
MERLRWSPDGRALLVSGSDGKGRGGLFIVDTATAEARPVAWQAGSGGFAGCWSRDGKAVYYIQGAQVRARDLASGKETALYNAAGLRHIATSPDGKWLAVAGRDSIALVPLRDGHTRKLAFEESTELEWGADLMAARGTDLWRIPIDGGSSTKLEMPGNRMPGFSLHPDGLRVALTAGRTQSEVWAMSLGR